MMTAIFSRLKSNPLVAFFGLTFVIAWSIWLPLGLLAPEKKWLSLPGAWAPTIASLLLIGLSEGLQGIRVFLKRLFHWRVSIGWYLVVLFGISAIASLAIQAGILLGSPSPALTLPAGVSRGALPGALPIIFLVNIFLGGPLAEDIGWRGYILPKMRERMSALHASLIIGVIWAIWHLPYFLFLGWRDLVGDIPFLWFALLTTSWSVLFAWVYVNTQSILMPVLFHAAINTTLGTLGVLGQRDGNFTPLLLNILLTWLAVAVVVKLYGTDLIRKAR
jgi:uncharacterized protein